MSARELAGARNGSRCMGLRSGRTSQVKSAWGISTNPQGRLKVISSRARCHASQCEHSPDVVAQFLLTRVN